MTDVQVRLRTGAWLFVATTFTASTLLFLVQPMFAKMALPKLGGSPAVWSTCVLFFQATLLAGYLYSHLTVRWLGVRRQAWLHVVLVACALPLLPLTMGNADPPAGGSPVGWLLLTLTLRLGLPFFALSTLAPLVQRWFAALPGERAANPYFLYVASNIGSFLALLAYPFLLEPLWGTRAQARLWSGGYLLLVALVVACALRVRRDGRELPSVTSTTASPWGSRLRWTALAFVPSSLMLGVTTHISTDLASIPLLWVLPLAAYLLTFILAFSPRAWIPTGLTARAFPLLAAAAIFSVFLQLHAVLFIPVHLLAFFAAALVCHTALAHSRPGVEGLTEFYVWMSFGGMLGGVFNTLVAPHVFTGIFEYPILLAAACFARPSPSYGAGRPERWATPLVVGVTPLVVGLVVWASDRGTAAAALTPVLIVSSAIPALAWACLNRTAPFNLLIAAAAVAMTVGGSSRSAAGHLLFAGRSFFGVSRVVEAADGSYRLLQHGTTLHGRQNRPAGSECEPQSYYDPAGPMGDLFRRSGRHFTDVVIAGLGSGGLACYAETGSRWTFIEIDPLVERIARDPSLFTYLPNSPGLIHVAIGDGRKQIEAAPPASYDLIFLDAFSSDSVPAHLLTEEAIDAYFARLRPSGFIVLHISNRYLDLEPVVGRLVADRGLPAVTNQNVDIPAADVLRGRTPSQFIVLASAPEPLGALRAIPGWRPLTIRAGVYPWTDDYSNLLRSIRWR